MNYLRYKEGATVLVNLFCFDRVKAKSLAPSKKQHTTGYGHNTHVVIENGLLEPQTSDTSKTTREEAHIRGTSATKSPLTDTRASCARISVLHVAVDAFRANKSSIPHQAAVSYECTRLRHDGFWPSCLCCPPSLCSVTHR